MFPFVSIIISVCNEAEVIEKKLKNLLASDYPAEQMEILVGSDGCVDQTVQIIKEFSDYRIRLFEFPSRRGKSSVLNDLVPQAKGEILIFTDARQIFAKNGIEALVQNFADPKVGCASGELILGQSQASTGKGIHLYWNYEKFLRRAESQIHSMIGATGAIYAIRKELYTPLPPDVVLDDVYIPLRVVERGFRCIFDNEARAYDQVAENPSQEHARKARTLYGNYQIFTLFSDMFNPAKSYLAFQLFSHKFLRVMVPFLLVGLFAVNIPLMFEPFYRVIFFSQVIFYGLAFLGYQLRNSKWIIPEPISRLTYIPYVFCLLNYSALVGFVRFVTSGQSVAWEKAGDV